MKCEFCGAAIDIESAVCPHCGMEKRQFEQHRQDMGDFSREFHDVRTGVVEENKRFSKKAAFITVIAILVVLNLLVVVGLANNYEIYSYFRAKEINANAEKYTKELARLEAEGDYDQFYLYYNLNQLHMAEHRGNGKTTEYSLLNRFCAHYHSMVEQISKIAIEGYEDNRYRDNKSNQETYAGFVAEDYEAAYRVYDSYVADEKRIYFSDANYKEEHLKSYDDVLGQMDALLKNYCGFTDEELVIFKEASKFEKQTMILEKVRKESTEDEQ